MLVYVEFKKIFDPTNSYWSIIDSIWYTGSEKIKLKDNLNSTYSQTTLLGFHIIPFEIQLICANIEQWLFSSGNGTSLNITLPFKKDEWSNPIIYLYDNHAGNRKMQFRWSDKVIHFYGEIKRSIYTRQYTREEKER